MNNTYINNHLYELNVDLTYVYISLHKEVGSNKLAINGQIKRKLLKFNHFNYEHK
mgnify:CR=1 FL=1